MWWCCVLLLLAAHAQGKLDSEERDEEDTRESEGDRELDDDASSDRIGAAVTQVTKHPYAASLLNNNSYVCSAVILNTYWLITESKCFDSKIISSYVTHRNLTKYLIKVGSSYNNKGGTHYQISMLINNFDMKVSAVKLNSAIEFNARVNAVNLPAADDEASLGYLATIVAWTPVGHIRAVNAPLIDSAICESFTKLLPGHYICLGGVQDPNRHFCRRDDGGAVIQNNTLIGIASFIHTCASYTRTHAFPKVSSFVRWLDSIIWDEDNRPTTTVLPTTTIQSTTQPVNSTENASESDTFGIDPRKFMMKLPFAPINVPLEPSGDNIVLPRMSMYESYLKAVARAKTSTTPDPKTLAVEKRNLELEWRKKFGNSVMVMPSQLYDYK